MNSATPISANNRTVIIDIIRGFALFGVLAANLTGFIGFALPSYKAATLITTIPDKLTEHFISFFIDGKFIMIFSILFGYGFGVLMDRVEAKGVQADKFFVRRMIILLMFGLVHLAIWWGEILNVYALAGLLMLLLRKTETRKLLRYGLFILFMIAPLIQGFRIFFLPPADEILDAKLDEYSTIMLNGNIFEIFASNYKISAYVFIERCSQWKDVAEALGKFLLGYFVYRSGFLKDIPAFIAIINKVFRLALVVAIIYLVKKVVIEIFGITYEGNLMRLIDYEFSNIGTLALSLFYCTSIIKIYYKKNNLGLFKAFASVGTMSLTNYISHTFFYVFFFYGLGFGMLGKVHVQWVLPLTLLIYTLQIFISRFWIKRFQFGPVEWLWRMLSYNKYFPIKKM